MSITLWVQAMGGGGRVAKVGQWGFFCGGGGGGGGGVMASDGGEGGGVKLLRFRTALHTMKLSKNSFGESHS